MLLLDMPLPPTAAKEALYREFVRLAHNREKFPLNEEECNCCPVCRSPLVTLYDEPEVCEKCLQPLFDALDNLVRLTKTVLTPENLREEYIEALRSVADH